MLVFVGIPVRRMHIHIGGFLPQFCIGEQTANSSFVKPLSIYLFGSDLVILSRQKCVRVKKNFANMLQKCEPF
jgi:hypothetical protein